MLPEGVIDNTLDDDYKIDCNEPPQNIGGQNLNSTIVSNNSKTPNHEIMLPERVMPAAHEGCLRHTKRRETDESLSVEGSCYSGCLNERVLLEAVARSFTLLSP